ncbi:hypothetical protein FHETE_4332 [Fusarium heterosporum]|uniref:Uncharacterized protein n=1 Tax=Fusarium heterosporum TaxID=42747 RepID=A0A8H5TET6_FUSHE|nr:hypothetical protein FHETE_4332 [Fusarium heterosporum]
MGRRDTYSEPPRGNRQSRREPQRGPPIKQKEWGFDWTPGIALALVGAITFFSKDFDRYKKRHDGNEIDRRSRDSDRGRRKHRSNSRYSDDGYYDDHYRRDRGYSR